MIERKGFGTYIKEKRIEKGYTQKNLADLLYVGETAVSKWERGVSYPDITLIPDLCKILGVNEHELITSSNDTEYRRIKQESKNYNRIKDLIFYIASICYGVALLTCFIVNLAVDHGLSWFFIVFASLLTGFTFIPTCLRFFKKNHLLIFIGTTFFSMFVLFLTCSIYTNDYWFMVATSSVALGYFAFFYPFVFFKHRIYMMDKKFQKFKKFFVLSYSTGLLVLTIVMLLFINLYYPIEIEIGILITLYSFIGIFIIGFTQLINVNRFIRSGIDLICLGIYLYGLNGVLSSLLGEERNYYTIDFSDWSNNSNGNTTIIMFVSLFFIGLGLLITGLIKKNNEIQKNQ